MYCKFITKYETLRMKKKIFIKKKINTAIQLHYEMMTHLKYIMYTQKNDQLIKKTNTRAGARVKI